jgi:hypothetical protein
MPKGWLYNWAGMARGRKQNPETRFVGSFLIVYLCVLKLSLIDAQKDSSCAHKGLVTNCPHHTRCTANS